MCFLVGNDFLPHLPSIEIMEGGMDILINVYKEVCQEYGHLTEEIGADIKFNKKTLEMFMKRISTHEKKLFENKLKKKDKFFPDELLEKNASRVEDEDELPLIEESLES